MRNTGRGLRWLGHLLVMVVLVAALAPVTPATVVRAATDTVTNCSGDPAVVGSLPNVLAAARAGDTIIFAQDCTGGTAITLTATLTPAVSVTIDAITPPHAVAISGGGRVRPFNALMGTTLGLRGLTLANGSGSAILEDVGTVNVVGCTFSGNSAPGDFGGAIQNFGGTLNITGSTFSGNDATFSGNTLSGGGGGAIRNFGGTLNVAGSTFSSNTASSGGAILNDGTLNVTGSTFSSNTAIRGGAITSNGTLNVAGSTFSSNTTNSGGAIDSGSGTVNVTGSTFSSNAGSAISNITGTLNVVNDTFSGNTSSGNGGAIANSNYGIVNITGSTFSGNTAVGEGGAIYNIFNGTLRLALSVVAGNTVDSSSLGPDIRGNVTTDGGGNVVGNPTDSTGLTAPSDKLNVAPLLAPLGNNGGPVQTFALLSGSPAIDIAACPTDPITGMTLTVDARGVSRPQGPRCDAGSYEASDMTTSVAPTAVADTATVTTGMSVTIPVLANDTLGTPAATITAVSTPVHGTAAISGMGITYTSTGAYVGTDSFTYTITNSAGTSTATVTITVTGIAPTAVSDSATTSVNTAVTIPVLANDTLGTPAATISGTSTPMHGTAAISGASITYTPTGGYVGTDSFTYTTTNSAGSSTATVTVTVNAAQVTGLTTTAPTGNGSGNTGSPGNPTMLPGAVLTLNTTGTYSNNTSGPVSGLTYTGSNPTVAGVDANGTVRAFVPGQITVTVTGPNGTRTTITVTVTMATGSGLVPPAPAPMVHGAAPPAAATPLPQPMTHPVGNGTSGGVGPRAAGSATATPAPQPARH